MNDKLLTISEASKLLNVHWQTIRNYIDQGKLKSHKVGKLVRIRKEDLDNFVTNNNESNVENRIEIELRYLLEDRKKLEQKLLDLGAKITYQAHVIDHWYIPSYIKNRKQHDDWFDNGRGCGVRIREQDNGYTGNVVTTLETKRLTLSMNHNTFLESDVIVESYEKTRVLLEMMDLKEFLTIDKNRVMYSYKDFKICIDEIKNFGVGVEIEISSFDTREKAIEEIQEMATELGFNQEEVLEKSMTVLSIEKLAHFE